jgi:serine/threonine-protein kinase
MAGADDLDRTASYAIGAATSDGQRFRILRPHARGGLGAVFVALDTELHREVALKQILDHHADDPVSRRRFLIEAETTGGLEHPGIVPVYGLGTYGDGRPYYAMRFVRGDSLKEAIDRFHGRVGTAHQDDADGRGTVVGAHPTDPGHRSLELRKLLRRFTDVCNAIDYAHSRGVLHRDIKPANVILGMHGETLVVDWGLAKPLGRSDPGSGERTLLPSSSSGSSETLPGSALGTPSYMSPEQAQGDLDRLGPRSDVYSLGATLYCLLTGQPPHKGDDAAAILRAVQRGAFRPPRAIDPTIDAALEAVCLKAMALEPEDRYGSPRALAEEVERWMADERVTAWHEPWARSLTRWLTRHRVGVTAAGAAVLMALVGTLTVLGVQTRANAALKGANTDLAIANTKVTRANADLAAANQRERARFALAQEAIRTFHTGVSEDILLKQEEFKALRTKLLRGAREFYRKLEQLLQGQRDRDSRVALGRAYLEVGELTYELDAVDEAQAIFRRAVALFEALSSENDDDESRRALAHSQKSLAMTLMSVGRDDDALAASRRSRDLFRGLAEADPADRRLRSEWADAELLYSAALSSSHRPAAEELEAIERARSIVEADVGAGPGSVDSQALLADVYHSLAWTLEEAGRIEQALLAYERARDLLEALFRAKPEDPKIGHELVRLLGNMGLCLTNHGRHAEGLAAYDKAMKVLKVARAANPTIVRLPMAAAWIDGLAAHVLVVLGRKDDALAALRRARDAREMLIKADPTVTRNREELRWVLRQTADIHRSAGRMSDALEALQRRRQVAASLAESNPQNREYHFDLASACADVGDLQGTMGKPAEAIASFAAALAIRRKMVDVEPSTASHRSNLAATLRRRGIALHRCGRPADALQDFRQSIAILQALVEPTPGDYYDMGRAYSLISGAAALGGSGLTAADGRAAAIAAMAALERSVAAGWRDLSLMRVDTDLESIRSRSDFQLLMRDMAFPADPFARRDTNTDPASSARSSRQSASAGPG